MLSDVAGFAFVTRGKDYTVLEHPLIQARLHLPPDQSQQRPESQTVRCLYDCPPIPVGTAGHTGQIDEPSSHFFAIAQSVSRLLFLTLGRA